MAIRRERQRLLVLVVGCWLASGATQIVHAATFVVTKLEDDAGGCDPDDCALREAVIAANALPGADRIEVAAGTYSLTIPGVDPISMAVPEIGDLDIRDEVELVGDSAGKTVIVGNGADRVVSVAFTSAYFSHIHLAGGRDLGDGGGCVFLLESAATFVSSSMSDCFAEDGGGGLAAFYSSATLINTTVSNNESGFTGGGIVQAGGPTVTQPDGGRLELINSTVTGNRSNNAGAGIHVTALLILRHSTIADNETLFGTAIFSDSTVRVYNSILEGTCTGFRPTPFGRNLVGPDPTNHCLILNARPEDIVSENLGLAPLADNGGPTMTHALLRGSPAIDAAADEECEPTDQRGVARPISAACDIGAVESSFAPIEIPALGPAGLAALAGLLVAAGAGVIRLRGV